MAEIIQIKVTEVNRDYYHPEVPMCLKCKFTHCDFRYCPRVSVVMELERLRKLCGQQELSRTMSVE